MPTTASAVEFAVRKASFCAQSKNRIFSISAGAFLVIRAPRQRTIGRARAIMDNFLKLRRKIYLAIIPLLLCAVAIGAYFSRLDVPRLFLLLILALFLIISFLSGYRYRFSLRFHYLGLGIFTLYEMMLIFRATGSSNLPYAYVIWTPLYFFFVFWVLRERGLVFATITYLIFLGVGVAHVVRFHENLGLLTQFYLANLINIILLSYVQRLAAGYIRSDSLSTLVYLDPLTHIANRRMLERCMAQAVGQAQEHGTALSIIYMDLDHFKDINDARGHDAGDQVLQEFAALVQPAIRSSDYFGRWGGEEFLIVANSHSAQQAQQLAERLRHTLENHDFPAAGKLTASFGIASFQPHDSPHSLLQRADNALYAAKKSGRNTIRVG